MSLGCFYSVFLHPLSTLAIHSTSSADTAHVVVVVAVIPSGVVIVASCIILAPVLFQVIRLSWAGIS